MNNIVLSPKISLFDKLVMLLLITSPILQTYGWGHFNFAFILSCVFVLVEICTSGFGFLKCVPRLLFIYLCYWYFSHLIATLSPQGFVHLGILKAIFVYALFYKHIYIDYFIKLYEKLAIFCIAFFFLQEIAFYVQGSRMPGIVPFFPIALNIIDSTSEYLTTVSEMTRSSSFFSEPAHFVQFLLPLLSIEIFYYKKIKLQLAGIILLTLLLLQSGNALLGLFGLSVAYLYDVILKNNYKKKVTSVFIISVVALLGYIYVNSDMGKKLLERQHTITVDDVETMGYAGSGFVRTMRGYYIFSEYSTLKKITGDDTPEYISSAAGRSLVSMYFEDEDDRYMNTCQTILCYTGLIGLCIFVFMLFKLWKNTTLCGKAMILEFVFVSLAASFYFANSMAVYLILPYALALKDKPSLSSKDF